MSGLLPCVSQVFSLSLRPSTPPLAFQWAISIFAAASAGLSNGAIAPLESNAQPMTMGFFAVVPPYVDVATTAAAIAATATIAANHLPRLIRTPPGRDDFVQRARPKRTVERLLPAASELVRGQVPQGIGPRIPEGPIVAEDLQVVVTAPPDRIERTKERCEVGTAVARQHTVGPRPCRLAPVGDVDADEPLVLSFDVVQHRLARA